MHARERKGAARKAVSACKIRACRAIIKGRFRSISVIQRIWRSIRLQRSKRKPVPSPFRPLAPPSDPEILIPDQEERFSRIEIPEERVSTLLDAVMRPPRTTIDTISSELNAFSAQLAEERSLRLRAEHEKTLLKGQFEDLKDQYERLNVEHSQLSLKKAVGIDKESMELLTSNLFEHLDRPETAGNEVEMKRLQGEIAAKDREMAILRLKLETFEKKVREKEGEVREARENEGNARAQARAQAEEILQLKRQVKGDISADGLKELKLIKGKYEKLKADLREKEDFIAKIKAESAAELESLRNDYDNAISQLREKSVEVANLASTYKSQVESIQKANLDQFKEQLITTRDQFKAIIDKKNAEIAGIRQRLEDMEGERSQAVALQEFYQEQVAEKEKELAERVKRERALEKEVQNLHQEKLKLNNAYEELKQGLTGEPMEQHSDLQRAEVEQMAVEIEHSKKINSTLVTLLRYKNTELDFYRKPGEADEGYLRKLDKLRVFETELLQK